MLKIELIQSKMDKDKLYLFESLGFIKSEHMENGSFGTIPSKLESTLELNTPNPKEKDKEALLGIIKDCELQGLVAAYDAASFCGAYKFLKACNSAVFELPYRIHTLRKI